MVAPGTLQSFPAATIPNPIVRRMGFGSVHFTVDDALGMVERGILPEDSTIELLDGSFVYRDRFDLRGNEIVEGLKHNYTISAISRLAGQIDTGERHLRTQNTLVCAEAHAPIPDAVILRGPLTDYKSRLPTAADAFCVVEVADSSYERDVGDKLRGYARAGVEQYVIINLRNDTAEVYSIPDTANGTYPPPRIVAADHTLSLRVGEAATFDLLLSSILP